MFYSSFWSDSYFAPAYGTGVSALVLVLQGVYARWISSSSTPKDTPVFQTPSTDSIESEGPVVQHQSTLRRIASYAGSPTIFAAKLTRLLCCLVLCGLSLATSLQARQKGAFRRVLWNEFIPCEVYGYASALALASILSHHHGKLFTGHLNFVLLFTSAIYLWRDVVPLFLKHHAPADASEGVILWTKLLVLFVGAVAIPLIVPRVYVPYNPSEPMEKPSEQQTASWLSLGLFSWVNTTVYKASRVSHLSLDEFPPLPDTNTTKNLVERTFPEVDPFELGRDEHVFWGLIRVYRSDYLAYTALTVVSAFLNLASPLAVKGLLSYLEENSKPSDVYAWAWILLLFFGSLFITFTQEWYQWIIYVQNFRTQAIITELLFQHALRIRMKSEYSSTTQEEANEAEKDKSGHLVGKINNLVTSDIENVKNGNKYWLQLFIKVPIHIAAAIWFVYSVLGWSALVGLASIIILLPVPGYLSSWIQSYQAGMMSRTDVRVQLINETLGMARMIKLFGWEARVADQIDERRRAELAYLRKTKFLQLVNNLINFSIPLVTMGITFATYTGLAHEELTASKLFSSMTAFLMIQIQLHFIFYAVPVSTQARVSLDRINSFLHDTELLDEFEEQRPTATAPETASFARPTQDDDMLGLAHTTFTWATDSSASDPNTPAATEGAPRRRRFALQVEKPVIFQRGRINLVVGPTGSGKTSLLMALLGEMHAVPQGPGALVGLPRAGGVAYAAQESWVQNETIQDNILFGAPYDEVRYNKVIKQCALERDLGLFDAGDKTEVGEKGITLSGGQKARITLARAVYSSAEILLLDDVLAALDVHTGRWIVDKCFMGDLVRGRTVILVSHNMALTRPIADFVVALGNDGRIVSQGSLDKALQADSELYEELKAEVEELVKADQVVDNTAKTAEDSPKDGKLVVAEEISTGRVGWNALQLYFKNTARTSWLYWSIYFITLSMTHVAINGQAYFLGHWAAQYETHDPSDVSVVFYLANYLLLIATTLAIYTCCWSKYVYGSIRVSNLVHKKLVASILGTTLRWFDKTPTSRIITRCTTDIQAIDTTVSLMLHELFEGAIYLILRIVSVMLVLPVFIVPAVIACILGGWLSVIYMRAQLSVKREMSNAQAPVIGHFGGAIAGLVSIRAYGAQEQFKRESYVRMDRYTRASLIYAALNRWVTIRVDTMSTALTAILAWYLTYVANISASNAGFALSMAVGFSGYILEWMRTLNDFQVNANSLERIQQYMAIEQEPKPTKAGIPPAYWPASGDLHVEKLTARYSQDGPRVLHDISFEVKSGERIGIVGRTGSGKSSLTLALLRCILTEGRVYYDGISTDSINLDALRSNITIIPQMPELLRGTLRQNLDPFGQHDDATLNSALRSAGLFSVQERTSFNETNTARITLDSEISGGGGNLSVGQRQIIALARAIVRSSKLLILDEATSAIDYDTDAVIQKSLREELGKNVTVLTVAHRLQSIMDADKIMVLDAGRIVEFDSPRSLLSKDGGHFRGLVDGSGDWAALYAMAGMST